MRKVLPLVVVVVAGLLLYWAWTNQSAQHAEEMASTSRGVVGKVVESGRAVGEKAGDVFDSLGFGGKK